MREGLYSTLEQHGFSKTGGKPEHEWGHPLKGTRLQFRVEIVHVMNRCEIQWGEEVARHRLQPGADRVASPHGDDQRRFVDWLRVTAGHILNSLHEAEHRHE